MIGVGESENLGDWAGTALHCEVRLTVGPGLVPAAVHRSAEMGTLLCGPDLPRRGSPPHLRRSREPSGTMENVCSSLMFTWDLVPFGSRDLPRAGMMGQDQGIVPGDLISGTSISLDVGQLLAGRYHLDRVLRRGEVAQSLLARDMATGRSGTDPLSAGGPFDRRSADASEA